MCKRMKSLGFFSAAFAAFAAAFSEAFTAWGRTEGPRGQIATHHLFLGHQAATAPLHTWWPPGPVLQQRLLHFCSSKIVRKSCGRLETMVPQQMRIPSPPPESCIAAPGSVRCFPTCTASPSGGYWPILPPTGPRLAGAAGGAGDPILSGCILRSHCSTTNEEPRPRTVPSSSSGRSGLRQAREIAAACFSQLLSVAAFCKRAALLR